MAVMAPLPVIAGLTRNPCTPDFLDAGSSPA